MTVCALLKRLLMPKVDPLNHDSIVIEFQPLYEAMHIYDCLNKNEEFRDAYNEDRRKQMDLLLPATLNLNDDGQSLRDLLANITGFAIIERATASKTQNFRSVSEIEGLWDIMCTRLINLISDTVANINEPRLLLSVKSSVMLFMQTIQVYSHRQLSLANACDFRDTTSL
jgi:exocyst complex component 6